MPAKAKQARRTPNPSPDYERAALRERRVLEAYQLRPPYQRNDYIGCNTRAKNATDE